MSTSNYQILFFSDLHITFTTIDLVISKFNNQLEHIQTQYIIINGDFIDESVEYYTKEKHKKFLKKLTSLLVLLSSKTQNLIWISGNHDEFFIKNNHIELSKNIQIEFTNYFNITINSNNYVCIHGHELDSRYIFHQILRILPFKNALRMYVKSTLKKTIPNSSPQMHKIKKIYSRYSVSNTFKKNTLIFGHFHQELEGKIEEIHYFQSISWEPKSPLPLYAITSKNSIIKLK
ncbi:MAG: metallophosphoesterase [Candidatus Woesearchaeota archaeon]